MKKIFTVIFTCLSICGNIYGQNVGIGTSTPQDKLTVFTQSSNYGILHTDGDIQLATWVGNGGGYLGTKSIHPIRFFTANGATQMTLLTNGHFGIGMVPSLKLEVKQDVANKAIGWQHELTGDSWAVGIGTNTLNCRFEFNGILKGQISSADGSYITGSDFRLKELIQPLSALLAKTMQLKPSTYFYMDSRSKAKNRSVGFIAHEVEKIFPELVHDMEGGYKGLNYSGFAVIAIKAIQEQQNNIEQQQQVINEQNKTISNLAKRLLEIENTLANL